MASPPADATTVLQLFHVLTILFESPASCYSFGVRRQDRMKLLQWTSATLVGVLLVVSTASEDKEGAIVLGGDGDDDGLHYETAAQVAQAPFTVGYANWSKHESTQYNEEDRSAALPVDQQQNNAILPVRKVRRRCERQSVASHTAGGAAGAAALRDCNKRRDE
jgi:hypothetical protein